jgi:AAA+ superfamily predicted ATPase
MSAGAPAIALGLGGHSGTRESFAGATEHLVAELDLLRARLHREVLRLRAAGQFTEDQFRGLYVSDQQVNAILLPRFAQQPPSGVPPAAHSSLRELDEQIRLQKEEIALRTRRSFELGIELPLPRLAGLFHLSEFDAGILMIAAATELDLRFETLFSYAQNDVNKKRPSVDLALKLLCATENECWMRRSSLSADARLFAENLLAPADEHGDRPLSFLARPLRAEDRVIAFLLEQAQLDARLLASTTVSRGERTLSGLRLPEALSRGLRNIALSRVRGHTVVLLHGPRGSGKRSATEALCAELGHPLLVMDLNAAVLSSVPLRTLLELLHREAILQGADVLLGRADVLFGEDSSAQQQRKAVERALQPSRQYRVFVASEAPWPSPFHTAACAPMSFEFPVPAFADRAALWQERLSTMLCDVDSSVDTQLLANKFVLTGGEVSRACHQAAQFASARSPGVPVTPEDLEAGARAQSRHGLRRLGQKIAALSDWSALVLPAHSVRQLRDVLAAQKYRHIVYEKWGFEERLSLGKGLNALFCGPSGTGKTMAAGILAREFGLDLYKLDLSVIVSKYIGETEKQLGLVFREARASNAILFFDEADALFGKRSEVKDAHDRYANVEVAYLLQKMEEHEGIVILATNFRKNLDDAFIRRMHHIVEFPFPGPEDRERIWRGMIPAGMPLAADVNFAFLARQFELAGGNIRNVALAAAFLAAEEESPVRMEHFVICTARELQKLGKLPSRSEFREHYDLIRLRV